MTTSIPGVEKCTFNFPTVIRFGIGALAELGPHLCDAGFAKPLIVTDPGLAKLDLFAEISSELGKHPLSLEVFSGISKNPRKKDVLSGVDAYVAAERDCIVGIGGGAAMDVARAIALKINHYGDLFDYEDSQGGDRLVTEEIPYFVTVPTTSGTGSEVGRSTVIADDDTGEKKIIFSPRLMAKMVFADPGLTMNLPPGVTAATGIDALTHNLEAFVAKGFHPLCDGVAIEALRMIVEALPQAVHNPTLESRANMMLGALMGAVAFQKGLGVIHSCAHALSAHNDLHHGLANALLLSHGVRFNIGAAREKYARIAGICIPGGSGDPEALPEYFHSLVAQLGLPTRLSDEDVEENDIELLAALAYRDVCHQLNPRALEERDFVALFRAAL